MASSGGGSSGGLEWAPLRVAYDQEKQRMQPAMDAAQTHPLQKAPPPSTGARPASAVSAAAGPAHEQPSAVSAFAELDPLSLSVLKDPLSAAISTLPPAPPLPSTSSSSSGGGGASTSGANASASSMRKQILTDAERTTRSLWQLKKDQILADYAVSGVLTISNRAAALFGPAAGGDEAGNKKVLDKYEQRLAALESRAAAAKGGKGAGAGATVKMTQQDYEVPFYAEDACCCLPCSPFLPVPG
jgi:hypothetical protein